MKCSQPCSSSSVAALHTRLTRCYRLTEQESTSGILFRNEVLTYRLASLFTIFRQWDDYMPGMDTLTCTDVDSDNTLRIS